MNNAEILAGLTEEITIITRLPREKISPEKPLRENGINSMGFIELLLAADRRWHVSLAEKGVSPADVKSLSALADRIAAELEKQ